MDGLSVRLHDNSQPAPPLGDIIPQPQPAICPNVAAPWSTENLLYIFGLDIAAILPKRCAKLEIRRPPERRSGSRSTIQARRIGIVGRRVKKCSRYVLLFWLTHSYMTHHVPSRPDASSDFRFPDGTSFAPAVIAVFPLLWPLFRRCYGRCYFAVFSG